MKQLYDTVMIDVVGLMSRPAQGGPARRDRGASLVEYALLVSLIAVVCIAAVFFLGDDTSQKFSEVGSRIGDT